MPRRLPRAVAGREQALAFSGGSFCKDEPMKTIPIIIFSAATLLGAATSSHAVTIIVDTLESSVDDDGMCSLAEAILNANSAAVVSSDCGPGGATGTTIQFDPSLAGGTIELTLPLQYIAADLQIEGPGHGPDSLTIDGMDNWWLFKTESAITLQLSDMTLTRGRDTNFGGGAVQAYGGADVTLQRTRLVGNSSESSAAHGGAISVIDSSLSLIDSEASDNQVFGGSAGGGAISASNSTLSIHRSTISGNRAHSSIAGGILLREGSELTAVNSTISGNHSHVGGGGLYVDRSDATLVHTTVAFNIAGTQPTHLTQDIALVSTSSDPATLVLDNSLVVQGASDLRTCAGGSIINTGSLSTHDSCTGTATEVEDIGLLGLADNGGLPWIRTHALPPSSVAVGAAGDCVGDYGVTVDQRGNPRPGGDSGACDVGSFEVQSAAIFGDRFEETVQ